MSLFLSLYYYICGINWKGMKNFRDNFDEIYVEYFGGLCRFACEYLGDWDEARNLVQDVFLDLWQRGKRVEVKGSLSTYLCTLVKNRCIDRLRHLIAVKRHQKEISAEMREMEQSLEALESIGELLREDQDIRKRMNEALERLPEKCREIFLLSRLEGKKYREIAQMLDISINTVETQMSIALKKLKENFRP